MSSTAGHMPLARALGACAVELTDLAACVERLQHRLSPVLQTREVIQEAQALDLLTQSVDTIARYIEALALETPPEVSVNAAAAIANLPLADLTRRLLGAPAPAVVDNGECELFGGLP
jgi:hypothetical protein